MDHKRRKMNVIKHEMVHSDSFHCHLLLMAQDFMSRMKFILFTKSLYGSIHTYTKDKKY